MGYAIFSNFNTFNKFTDNTDDDKITSRLSSANSEKEGIVYGYGTNFEVVNSSYLNVSLSSSEMVYVYLISTPERIDLHISPNCSVSSTILTFSDFNPNSEYYLYQDGKLTECFVSDINGQYTYSLDITEDHHIQIKEEQSTIIIYSDGTLSSPAPIDINEDCTYYTLTDNIYEQITIERSGITLDGNGFFIQGTYSQDGVYIHGKSDITVKNLEIKTCNVGIELDHATNEYILNNIITGCNYGVDLWYGQGHTVEGNIITNHGWSGIGLHRTTNNKILGNTIQDSNPEKYEPAGIKLFSYCDYNTIDGNIIKNVIGDLGIGILLDYAGFQASKHNTISNNYITGSDWKAIYLDFCDANTFYGNTVENNDWGIWLYQTYNCRLYHNNIFDRCDDDKTAHNNWYDPTLLEGNYWGGYYKYTGVDDGSGTDKHAIAGDGIGDTGIPFPKANMDFYPFIYENGWLYNTYEGTDVVFSDTATGINITFSEVTEKGKTAITVSDTGPTTPDGFNFLGNYYDIETTAGFTGLITIAIPYDETQVIGDEEHLVLMHWDEILGEWEDATDNVDTENNIIYGIVTDLSIHVILEEPQVITIKSDGSVVPFNAPINIAGNVYTFTSNIYKRIVVQADNIVIDGNGYKLEGPRIGYYYSGKGLNLAPTTGVSIKNINIQGWNIGLWFNQPSDFSLSGCIITDNYEGLHLYHTLGVNSISGNTISGNRHDGIVGESFSNSIISDNIMSSNEWGCIYFAYTCHNNIIFGNMLKNVYVALTLYSSSNNLAYENTLMNNDHALWISGGSTNNKIFHNNFINNVDQEWDTNKPNNYWYDPVTLEGNYWSDYIGVDDGSGTGKHAIAGDGIGDTLIPHYGVDYYPFISQNGWISNTPPIADAGLSYETTEGVAVEFDASGSTDPEGDSLQYRWDFDDDETWDTEWSSSPIAYYTWDDEYSGTVKVEVSDGEFSDTDTATVTINNFIPSVNTGLDQIIDEGQIVSFSGSFIDPGADTWTYLWDFGDGETLPGTLTPIHKYDDNGEYTVTLTVNDGDGGIGTDTVIITVNNVAPTLSELLATSINEGESSTLTGTITDPGLLDTFTLTVDWGDLSSIETVNYPVGTTTFSLTHSYLDDGIYTIALSIMDNDGDASGETTSVIVNNVAPTLSFSGPSEADEGALYTLTLSATDPGEDTIFEWEINWGDGNIETIPGNPSFATHTYADGPNAYTISVLARDEDGIYSPIYTNSGFEIGDFSEWVVNIPLGGSAKVVTSHMSDLGTLYLPIEGTYFAALKTDGPGSYTTIKRTFYLKAGTTISGWAAFDGWGPTFLNDNAKIEILNDLNVVIATPWEAVMLQDDYDGPWEQWFWTAPSDGIYTIKYQVTNDLIPIFDSYALFDGEFLGLVVTVNNVAPTLSISGLPEVDEGSPYTLFLGAPDPGDDTIIEWEIDWGDGNTEIISGNPSSITHTYADGPNSFMISASATDEDGTYNTGEPYMGFESGDFTDWTVYIPTGGFADVVTSHIGYLGTYYLPIDGNYFALLKTDGTGQYTSIKKTVTLKAGQSISGWAAFDAVGPYIFNDMAMVRILDESETEVDIPWYRDIALVGDNADDPWTEWSWTATIDGIYIVEYRIATGGPNVADSYALFDMEVGGCSVTVVNVAPTLSLSGLPEVDEGSPYLLYMTATDPGADIISEWEIDWGDGNIETFLGYISYVEHTYTDGPNIFTIFATATDEDGSYNFGVGNSGFETGDLTDWDIYVPTGASVDVVSSHTGDLGTIYLPMDGSYFALLKTDGPGSYTTLHFPFYLSTGASISGWAAFDAWDYFPFNDNASVQILDEYGDLIETVWYCDVSIVGGYGDGDWEEWTWVAPTSGNYIVEYRIANYGDNAYDSYALFDTEFMGFDVIVNNVAPSSIFFGPAEVEEGSLYTLTLSTTDPGIDTITEWEIDWGDGHIETVLGNPSFINHIYTDGPNTYTISGTVTDEDGTYNAYILGSGFEKGDFTGWDVFLPLGASADVVTSYISDLGTLYLPMEGTYFALLKADGPESYSTLQFKIYLTAGGTISGWAAFDAWDYLPFNDNAAVQILDEYGDLVEIVWYCDVNLIGSSGDSIWEEWTWTAPISGYYFVEYRIANFLDSLVDSYALFDGNFVSTTIFVKNVAPTLSELSATSVNEGSESTLSGTITDPGILDTFTVTVDWGDGSPIETFNYLSGTTSFTETHLYVDDNPSGTSSDEYTIVVIVEDYDLGFDTASTIITVYNVDPTADAGPDQVIIQGDTAIFSEGFTDPGSADTHTFLWDFGDGSPPSAIGSHEYIAYGIYTVTLTVTDDDGGVDTDTLIVTVRDIIPPTTTLTYDIYFGDIPPYYVSTSTQFVLTAEDNPFGSNVAVNQYQIDSDNPMGWVTYTGAFTINTNGTHTINYRSIDNAGNIEDYKSETFIVNAVELTYTGEVSGNYSDPVLLEAQLIDMATREEISDRTIVFTIGCQTISAVTDDYGVASAILILDQPSGGYTVSTSFAGDDLYLSAESEPVDFSIEKETAYLTYTGSTVVPLNAEKITLRVTVFDDVDSNWGDLTKIFVTFKIYSDTMALLEIFGPYQVEITDVDGIGVFEIDVNNMAEGSYLIEVILRLGDNDYYQGLPSDLAPLIVYEPTGDFVTGGGWIWDTDGNKGNFGFNVHYKKNGLPKGQAIYVYREGDWEYIVKANAWIGMAIIPDENRSVFEAKCVVQQYNSKTGELVWGEGNYRMNIQVWDEDKNGGEDVFQIRVFDKNGVVFHEAGYDLYGILQGGQIVIHTDKKK